MSVGGIFKKVRCWSDVLDVAFWPWNAAKIGAVQIAKAICLFLFLSGNSLVKYRLHVHGSFGSSN
jgi:hypothetical protein